jgi:hypothetical protein
MRLLRRENALVAAAGALAALLPARALRGFTVDDALIPARYAAHLARGLGYRFNAAGPITDGVTPLGFPYLLAPFAKSGPLAALAAAKAIGVTAWVLAAAVLALAVERAGQRDGAPAPPLPSRLRFASLLIVACSAPLAAWSAAGLETGLAAALAALAVALPELGWPRAGAAAAGLTAALRPEALPWALVVAGAPAPRAAVEGRGTLSGVPQEGSAPPLPLRIARLALAALPFLAVVAVRAAVFGRAVPLSVLAKPSDLAHGASYALACFLLTGPLAVVAPLSWARLDGWGRGLVAAVFVHFAAIALAGGDWMALSRLAVPALPTVVLAAAHLARRAAPLATAARLSLALAGEVFQLAQVGPAAARVGADRLRVLEELRPALAGAKVVAALDVGWVGAATDATIVDLAGLTDPEIAVLPGGHTSKAIPVGLLDARGVEAIVLLLKEGEPLAEPWSESFFARIVELRVAGIPGIGEQFTLAAESRETRLRYVVVRRVKRP